MRWAGHVARMGEGRGEAYTGFWWGNLRERGHLGEPGINGRIIKMNLQEVGCGVRTALSWLAQDRSERSALVNVVMNLRVPLMWGEFLD